MLHVRGPSPQTYLLKHTGTHAQLLRLSRASIFADVSQANSLAGKSTSRVATACFACRTSGTAESRSFATCSVWAAALSSVTCLSRRRSGPSSGEKGDVRGRCSPRLSFASLACRMSLFRRAAAQRRVSWLTTMEAGSKAWSLLRLAYCLHPFPQVDAGRVRRCRRCSGEHNPDITQHRARSRLCNADHSVRSRDLLVQCSVS
jgi:hypothetical protein